MDADTLGDLVARGLRGQPRHRLRGALGGASVRRHLRRRRTAGPPAGRRAACARRRPGDVVAMQLPNWMEAAAAFWASAFLGAVTVPIVHFYGRKELTHILGTAKPKVFITAEEFGRMQFQPDLCADIPIVGLVGTRLRRPARRRTDGGTIARRPGATRR